LKILPIARRELRELPENLRREAIAYLKEIRENPEPSEAKQLEGFPGYYRIHIGQYRFIYQVSRPKRWVVVGGFPHREIAYHPRTLRRFRNPLWIPNPAVRAGRRPVELLTDRAKRYRANTAITQPERRCIYCGAPPARGRRLEVEHIDGREANLSPENLGWTCRSCNTRKGAYFARRRAGRRTRQFNPRKKKSVTGARTLAEYMETLNALHGYQSRFTLSEAIEKMHRTPPEDRSEFAREIWERRREHGTDRRVPF